MVTIGIPTYNRVNRYLRETLESALGQSYSNLEFVVSDNGSTDNMESIVRSYADPRIRFSGSNHRLFQMKFSIPVCDGRMVLIQGFPNRLMLKKSSYASRYHAD
ncbi:glycosyltransferase family 2 protein [Sulfuricaulis sp.]|uniref:glycosyltransferase family 2 protein n=1 Tax=Sulfuricaulis sp. TaxID=2003553 RepID=UPI0034A1B36C